jgi:Fungal specific transcription factor domain
MNAMPAHSYSDDVKLPRPGQGQSFEPIFEYGEESEDEEDPYDVDDEMEDADMIYERNMTQLSGVYGMNNNSLMPAFPGQTAFNDRTVRSMRTLLPNDEPSLLAHYRPSATASPLMDPTAAHIFSHFVYATGPSLSIFERHPPDTSVLFQHGPNPSETQNIWTNKIPILALGHPALMHAVLALSSLHIARLQETSQHASLKHYHYSIRRLSKAIGIPGKRGSAATLAATLLLGYYETMSAEHTKWSSHLLGAKHLLKEIDYRGIAQQVKARRPRQRQYAGMISIYNDNTSGYGIDDGVADLDEDFVDFLRGQRAVSGRQGRVIHDGPRAGRKYTSKDLEEYEIQCDLFWWFCKQDVFVSALCGNRLM